MCHFSAYLIFNIAGKEIKVNGTNQFGSQVGQVIILQNKEPHQILTELVPLSDFSSAVLFWSSSDVLQLIIAAPSTSLADTLDCGMIHAYTFTSWQFSLEYSISGTCGGFGSSLAAVGDIDQVSH